MKRFFTTLNLIIISSIILFAQQGSGRGGNMPQIGVLSGKVIDKSSNTPVEYASIILYSMRDSSLVSGTITNATGGFLLKDLPMGRFYLDIKFLGYDHLIKHNIKINPKQTTLNLGKILLNVSAEEIGEVSIVADRTQIQYKLDKKVINVGQDVSAAGGSAVDVLEKSPSIQTDIDGNVTLRGSSSFTVFIDGKPTVLDANDALQQIPASEIQNIELITNPSAKYDPDGVAGIINIVMKKNRTSGISGIVNASIGTNHKYKGDFLVNFRADKFNWFIGGNYRDYTFLGGNESVRETYLPTQTNYLNYSGTRDMIRGGDGIKTGIDINLSTNQSLSLSANIGTFEFVRASNSNYESWTNLDPTSISFYNSVNNFERTGPRYSGNMTYQLNFSKPGHQIQAQVNYNNRGGSENESMDQDDVDINGNIIPNTKSSRRTTEEAEEAGFRTKIDYSLPLGQIRKLEAGYQSRLSNSASTYLYENFDIDNNSWVSDPNYSNDMEYLRQIHAVYSTYADEFAGFGIQAGIRGEYTYRDFNQITTNENFNLERFDFFPSLHISRKLGSSLEAQAGYSRRINRPRDRHLNPYPNFSDEFSVSQGNPMLEPEYTNSFELNFIKRMGHSSLSFETYYRASTNIMTRVQTLLPDGRLLRTWDNLNSDNSLGAELMANVSVSKAISIMASTNAYRYSLEGTISDEEVVANSFNVDGRVNATLKLKSKTRFQVNGFYRGPSATAQGTREAFLFMNVAARQSLFNDKLNLTLSVRDPFSTMHHKFTSETEEFYSSVDFNREAQVVQFSISYKINNYKSKRQKGENGGQEMDFDEDM